MQKDSKLIIDRENTKKNIQMLEEKYEYINYINKILKVIRIIK